MLFKSLKTIKFNNIKEENSIYPAVVPLIMDQSHNVVTTNEFNGILVRSSFKSTTIRFTKPYFFF
ncbi:hypothetical protein DICPUDRAFT_159752 [Dictyostelium purpureum]|uniref:Uncharacterized protein n=1 Tax=Dictyostelium purpureum TaxID=5786 RepID=F1A4X0_DICPU|nr:uncharacterized protein DICPUDRAFT_159752 [Dictyostelium purpureum]EGC28756.1 hypothetical protein DICPUDRAFT_159752 [Dictyostelium purpureum]|eukprot:XP_003294714.1 hypothetical protein DICPUDRAFT_159752 [Dictyostelium purpureum]